MISNVEATSVEFLQLTESVTTLTSEVLAIQQPVVESNQGTRTE